MQQTIIKKGKIVIIDGQPFSARGYPIRPFFPAKYPPRLKYRACGEEINHGEDDEMRRSYVASGWAHMFFVEGSGLEHAHYLYEFSFKHPILCYLFYRWWLPTLLTPEDRERFYEAWYNHYMVKELYRPYWAEFNYHHPVQFLLLFGLHSVFQFFVTRLTRVVKAVYGFFRPRRVCGGADG